MTRAAGMSTESSRPGPPLSVDLAGVASCSPAEVDHLLIAVAEDGLTPADQRHCSRLLGIGDPEHIDPDSALDPPAGVTYVPFESGSMRQGARAASKLGQHRHIHIYLAGANATRSQSFVLGLMRGSQRIEVKTEPPEVVVLLPRANTIKTADRGKIVGRRTLLARYLANTPSNYKNPAWLADRAVELAGSGLRVSVWDDDEITRRGFAGLAAVGAGSASPPRLVRMDYRGSSGPPVVLVGKGITFDTGGLSLKPPAAMPLMKTDMTGAAAVMGTMAAIRDLRLPIRVIGLLACAENMPSGSAMRPGDVIRHYGGRTTEILNTDAEGRLVLADCLAYAAARLDPRYLIDIASLTGSATVGLGRYHAAMYGTDNQMLRDLEKAAEVGDDPVWRMPLVPDYAAGIATPIADAANSNTDPSISAGSITAALFLKPFAGNTKWAHLDIAGVARSESDRPETRRGATGYGVSLLTNWLQALSDR